MLCKLRRFFFPTRREKVRKRAWKVRKKLINEVMDEVEEEIEDSRRYGKDFIYIAIDTHILSDFRAELYKKYGYHSYVIKDALHLENVGKFYVHYSYEINTNYSSLKIIINGGVIIIGEDECLK